MAEKLITNSEAMKAAKCLIDHYFQNTGPKPEIRIPATDSDTDVVLTRYIVQQAARDAAISELIEASEEVNRKFDPDMRNHFHFTRLRKAIATLKELRNV